MKIKEFLLGAGTIIGLLAAETALAIPQEGTDAKIRTAKIVCTASITGDVPLHTVSGAAQQKGMGSSWLITNTDDAIPLAITQIDSYGMDGNLLVSLTPGSRPTLEADSGGLFSWTVKPGALARLPHDFTMIYTQDGVGVTDPSLVEWYNVVFTVQSGKNKPISLPTASTALIERTEDLTVTPSTHFVVSRMRNECKFIL